jgi:shikimate 5-dehydrogenase
LKRLSLPTAYGGSETGHGEIVDGIGFCCCGLAESGFDPRGSPPCWVGADGSGSAVAVELAQAGASLHIFDVAGERADGVAARLRWRGSRRCPSRGRIRRAPPSW